MGEIKRLENLISACINKVVCGKIDIDTKQTYTKFDAIYESNGIKIVFSENDMGSFIRVDYNSGVVFQTDSNNGAVAKEASPFPEIHFKTPPLNILRSFNINKYSPGVWEKMISHPAGYESPDKG